MPRTRITTTISAAGLRPVDYMTLRSDAVTCAILTILSSIKQRYDHGRVRHAIQQVIVYATARQQDTELLTCDAHFDGLPDVVLFGKKDQSTTRI